MQKCRSRSHARECATHSLTHSNRDSQKKKKIPPSLILPTFSRNPFDSVPKTVFSIPLSSLPRRLSFKISKLKVTCLLPHPFILASFRFASHPQHPDPDYNHTTSAHTPRTPIEGSVFSTRELFKLDLFLSSPWW